MADNDIGTSPRYVFDKGRASDGNLSGMAKFTDETRRRLATGWDTRVCTAREYARQNGVSERAIRLWRSQLRHAQGSVVPGGNAAVPLQAAMDALHARLEELEGAVDAAHAAAAAARAALHAAAVCRDVPDGTEAASENGGENKHQSIDAAPGSVASEPAKVQAHPANVETLRPVPMPARGFSWF